MQERSRARVLAERSLRSCLARFATGVAVVSFDTPEGRLFLGEVQSFEYRDGEALAYLSSSYRTIAEQELGFEYLI